MIAVKQEIKEYKQINIIPSYPNWNINDTYSFGEILFDDHYYFRSVVDNNIGVKPAENSDKWLKWEISNRYAQIDLRASTKTVWSPTTAVSPSDNALITEFDNLLYDFLGFGEVIGEYIKVEILKNSDNSVLWTHYEDIYIRPHSNTWFNYYFDEFSGSKTKNHILRIPKFRESYIRTTIGRSDGGFAEVAFMVGGTADFFGDTLYGLSLGLNDNSLIEIDDFGVTTIKKRIASTYMDIDVTFSPSLIMDLTRLTRSYYGDIVLIVADESPNNPYDNLPILGYIESYTTVLANSVQIQGAFTIKEVI